jgi:hypothetical protein
MPKRLGHGWHGGLVPPCLVFFVESQIRIKPLSLFGPDLREALHAMHSIDPRKLHEETGKIEERARTEPKKNMKKEKPPQAE